MRERDGLLSGPHTRERGRNEQAESQEGTGTAARRPADTAPLADAYVHTYMPLPDTPGLLFLGGTGLLTVDMPLREF